MVWALSAVVFPTWQAVLLIVLCFTSLLIALDRLLFMVPIKSFVQRVESLGGGMRGIRTHVDGVRGEVDERIASVETLMHEQIGQARTDVEAAMELIAQNTRSTEAGLQKLDHSLQSLQADLRAAAASSKKATADLNAVRGELGELRNDFGVLEAELDGSVRKMVSESFQKIEGTVLSALEAVQEEMLRGASRLQSGREPRPSPPGAPARRFPSRAGAKDKRPAGKIISATPLFATVEKERSKPEAEPQAGHEKADSEELAQPEEQGAPAK